VDGALPQSLGGGVGDVTFWLQPHDCVTKTDGFDVISFASVAVGVLWLLRMKGTINRLSSLEPSAWKVSLPDAGDGSKHA
jgi:hypothetical protein